MEEGNIQPKSPDITEAMKVMEWFMSSMTKEELDNLLGFMGEGYNPT